MKKIMFLSIILLIMLILPILWYNQHTALCYPCPVIGKCPLCPKKGWEFKKPLVLQLLSLSKLSQTPSFNKKAVINGEDYQNYQQCASQNLMNRDNCYRLSAIANNDPSICFNIQDTSTTQYLRNNCILISETVNSSVLPLICKGQDESFCKKQEGCLPLYVSPQCYGCTQKSYAGCDIDSQFFCTGSGGTLDERFECVCPKGKTIIKPYGCFNCEKFSNSIAKTECIKYNQ